MFLLVEFVDPNGFWYHNQLTLWLKLSMAPAAENRHETLENGLYEEIHYNFDFHFDYVHAL